MSKITSVEPQKNSHRFNVFIDGKFTFGADEDLVVEHRLVVGKVLETADLEKLLFEAEVGKLMERMYSLFNIRLRSEKEIRDYLRNLSFKRKSKDQEEISDSAIELLINKLKQKKLVNDEEFAKAWMESRSKKKGKIAIKLELIQKGISKDVISSLMDQVSNEEELKVAQYQLEKKLRIWEKLPEIEFKKKSFDFLLRRGFDYEIVKHTIDKLFQKR